MCVYFKISSNCICFIGIQLIHLNRWNAHAFGDLLTIRVDLYHGTGFRSKNKQNSPNIMRNSEWADILQLSSIRFSVFDFRRIVNFSGEWESYNLDFINNSEKWFWVMLTQRPTTRIRISIFKEFDSYTSLTKCHLVILLVYFYMQFLFRIWITTIFFLFQSFRSTKLGDIRRKKIEQYKKI